MLLSEIYDALENTPKKYQNRLVAIELDGKEIPLLLQEPSGVIRQYTVKDWLRNWKYIKHDTPYQFWWGTVMYDIVTWHIRRGTVYFVATES